MYFYYDENGEIQSWNEDDELKTINFNPEENEADQSIDINDEAIIQSE